MNLSRYRWTIKVRVSNKSGVRTWSNSRGEGKLFSMDLVDQSGEIRCTAFREQCDKFYDMVEIGKVRWMVDRFVLFWITNAQLHSCNNMWEKIYLGYNFRPILSYTLSHPKSDRDVTERARGYTGYARGYVIM